MAVPDMDGLRERVGVLDVDRRDRFMFGLVGVLAVVLAVLPHVGGVTAYHREIVLTGLVFVMLGVSWNVIAGYAGQISLGHSAFFGIGAYVSAWLTTPSNVPAWIGSPIEALWMPAVLAVVGGGVGAALLALVTGPAMFRLRGHYFAVGTLALAAIVQVIVNNARRWSGGATGFYVGGGEELAPLYSGTLSLSTEAVRYYYALAATVLTIAAAYYLYHSRMGLGMRAIHGDEGAANSLGVNPLKYKMYAFVVSSFMVGVAGGLFAQYTLYINASSTLSIAWVIDALVVVILGGMGTIYGPVFGAVVFLLLDTFLTDLVGTLATTVEGAIIVLFVLFLPKGIYGYLREAWDRRGQSGTAGRSGGDEGPEGRQ